MNILQSKSIEPMMYSQKIIRHPKYSLPASSYAQMQATAMNRFARPWNPNLPLKDLGYGIGDFKKHDAWNLYDKYFFEGLKNLEDKVMLDFACGAGRNIANWWHRVHHIDGVDISVNMLTNAVAYLTSKNIPTQVHGRDIHLYLSNGHDLSVITTSQQYDIVTSTIALQHICVHEIRYSLLKDFYRVLKPDGYIAIQMAYGEDHPRSVEYYENYYDAPETNRACDVRVESPEQLRKDLEKIGFSNFEFAIDSAPPGSDLDRHGRAIYFRAKKVISCNT